MKIGIDIGGTFTDFVVEDRAAGQIQSFKHLSTPDAPERAVLKGLKRLSLEPNAMIVHGSTVATNAVLERKGARTALVTSEGFRDLLTIGRQNRRELYDFFADRPEPLVPPHRSFAVSERISFRGDVLVPLTNDEIEGLVEQLQQEGIESVAICLLFSFLHPEHERRLAGALENAGFFASASSDVLPEFREYERASTTAINAYVMPAMEGYLGKLESALASGSLRIMQSNGGSLSAHQAREQPVRAVLSGPAGGVVGALHIAHTAGLENVVSFDMGGTSTDVSLAMGNPRLTSEGNIDGLPIRAPMIDIHTVGSGGGSIARLDPGGSLRVGPESAGSRPGPACYGLGGREPTVTDANLVLGRIDSQRFLGGEMALDEDAGSAVISQLGATLEASPDWAALGVLSVVNANMARAIRLVSVERGHDPRDFVLVSFGGAGGLHACDVARLVGIKKVLVPPQASTLSAYGMLVADVMKDYVQTVMLPASIPIETVEEALLDLVGRGEKDLVREGIPSDQILLYRELDVRYVGQSYELTIPFQEKFASHFHTAHEEAFGYSNPDIPTEIVNVRVRAIGRVDRPEAYKTEPKDEHSRSAQLESRLVTLGRSTLERIPFFDGEQLKANGRLDGPAIVSYPDTTVFLNINDAASIDAHGNLIVEVGA